MDFLILIKNGCDNLTATASPSVDALGLHMVISPGHHHARLVWRPGSVGFCARRPGLQHGQVPELLLADHLRILLCEVL